ncbi:MAG: VOC family protein, partial [bacterium]
LSLKVMDALDRLTALRIDEDQVLLIFKKGASVKPTVKPFGTIPPTDGDGNLHLAFSISQKDVEVWKKRLAERDIQIESEFKWPEGGESIYFRDPDGHIIELKSSNWLGKEFDW